MSPIRDNINDNILARVRSFINRQKLLPQPSETAHILVGLSGGSDSVALLHILHQLGYNTIATHCHFGLRATEADRDLDFCQALARQLGVPFKSTHFDTLTYKDAHQISTEMACRELRYSWWDSLIRDFRNTDTTPTPCYICVGHHQDDSIETFLMNLMRGTGIQGLTGIRIINHHIVRPLMCLTRSDIISYLEANQLPYVTDSSNLENEYMRNKIRNQLIPMMEEAINPNARNGIAHTIRLLQATAQWAGRAIQNYRDTYTSNYITDGYRWQELKVATDSDTSSVFEHQGMAEELVYEFLKQGQPHIIVPPSWPAAICQSLREQNKGAVFSNHSLWVCIGEQSIIRCETPDNLTPGTLTWDEQHGLQHSDTFNRQHLPNFQFLTDIAPETPISTHPLTIDIDFDKVAQPVTLRRWQTSDRMQPFGMKGTKLVSDLFSNAHYHLLQKQLTWIMEDADRNIIWVCGLRLADRCRITPSTTRRLRVVYTPY